MDTKILERKYRTIEIIIGLSLIFICIVLFISNASAISMDTIKQDNQNKEKIVYVFPLLNITLENNQTYYLFSIVDSNISFIDLNKNFTSIKVGSFLFKKENLPIEIINITTTIEPIETIPSSTIETTGTIIPNEDSSPIEIIPSSTIETTGTIIQSESSTTGG